MNGNGNGSANGPAESAGAPMAMGGTGSGSNALSARLYAGMSGAGGQSGFFAESKNTRSRAALSRAAPQTRGMVVPKGLQMSRSMPLLPPVGGAPRANQASAAVLQSETIRETIARNRDSPGKSSVVPEGWDSSAGPESDSQAQAGGRVAAQRGDGYRDVAEEIARLDAEEDAAAAAAGVAAHTNGSPAKGSLADASGGSKVGGPAEVSASMSTAGSGAIILGTTASVTFDTATRGAFGAEESKDKAGGHCTFVESLNLSKSKLDDLMNVAGTFVYLRPIAGFDSNSYDLEMVRHDQVDPNQYFTLSRDGVTHFRDRESEFSSLAQWEREYQLFHEMRSIGFFQRYRRWKSFKVWEKGLKSDKMLGAMENITQQLFLFVPALRQALLTVRALSVELLSESMIATEPSRVYTLDEFVDTQRNQQQILMTKMADFSSTVHSVTRDACDEVVDNFLKVNNIVADHKMTFMERASLRSECRKLTRFLKLTDIVVMDALRALAMETIQKVESLVQATVMEPRINYDEHKQVLDLQADREVDDAPTPTLSVVASFDEHGDIVVHPSLDAFTDGLEEVIGQMLQIVSVPERVFTHTDMGMYIMVDSEDAEDTGRDEVPLSEMVSSDDHFKRIQASIHVQLANVFENVTDYVRVFAPYRDTFFENQEYVDNVEAQLREAPLETFEETIEVYKSQSSDFHNIPACADIGCMFVDSYDLKMRLMPSPIACLHAIRDFLPTLINAHSRSLLDEVGGLNPIVGGDPQHVRDFVVKKRKKDYSSDNFGNFKQRHARVEQMCELMESQEWPVPDNEKAMMRMIADGLNKLETAIQVAESKEQEDIKRFAGQLVDDVGRVKKAIQGVREHLDNAMIANAESPPLQVTAFLQDQNSALDQLRAESEEIQDFQQALRLPEEEFEILEEVQQDANLKTRLWSEFASWSTTRAKYESSMYEEIDLAAFERDMTRTRKTAFLAGKGLPGNDVVPRLKESADEFAPLFPVVQNLTNPSLKERHWRQIEELVGMDLHSGLGITLADLLEKNVTQHQEELTTIATAAQQESVLENMMAKVMDIWGATEFEVKPYKDQKDLYILGDTSEIITNLDDSLVTINTVLASRYVTGIRSMVDSWRQKLILFQETLDEWLACQKTWMYLETIFSAPDIIRQLPASAKTFQAVDKSWRVMMKATADDPNALKAGTVRDRRDTLHSHNEKLDQIQKELEDYLETKRGAFPRFYFLSNDELLEILSQSKDPRAVQPHLRKCFDNIFRLDMSDGASPDILAMYSGEGERVELGRNLKARGNVEDWLTAMETRMKETLRVCMKTGLLDYDTKAREDWVFDHPGQVVATVAQMTWARGTEQALRNANPVEAMERWGNEYKDELQKLIVKIRGNLKKIHRKIIVALVTTDVHARDIIEELWEKKIASTVDFLWQQQLRYYWDADIDDCVIRHSDSLIHYGYEYMGATSRLVITPLTDRCWLTLTGSYKLKLGGNPAGPAGTGKTESSKDLAKAMGIFCIVFNCSDQIDYKMMGKLFRGLAQAGCWTCLDEFNRIDIEVLSVIAQQLLTLREGRISGKSVINFMGVEIALRDHHVIITMNPGYAGRTELPDNLKVCFRPVAMMVPNYALIAEIMLFAEGFGDAKNLSRKMCKLYILCSEQLSQQPHYDYGLRAVKSVLVMAGALKRGNPDMNENTVLIRALRDSNVPKFLAADIPLFAAIVQDLFPGIEIPPNDYGELQVALEEEIEGHNLQAVPGFMANVIQMFDIFNIRFGATLVGPTGAGKTTCYQTLARVMTNLREKGSENQDFQKVRYQILNPKCIAMGELYGEFNELTQEWHDGLASTMMRAYVAEESEDRRWTVFDGPIDALWIENMNTVLDDNMTLCLANGERIKLKPEMRMLFEVMDLAVASPATVSRIGVVYMTPSDLGWEPYVKTWSETHMPEGVSDFVAPHLVALFEKYFRAGLAFQRRHCSEPVACVDVQLATSLTFIFEALFTPAEGVQVGGAEAQLKPLVEKLFAFSFVWSVGGSIASDDWEKFDEFARELFGDLEGVNFPGAGVVFDYYVDLKEFKFDEWASIVPSFEYNASVPYFQMLVPTVDTCRYNFIMSTLTNVSKPVFITGVTGTGKTVMVQNLLKQMEPPPEDGGRNVVPVMVSFSAQTQSVVTQLTIEGKLEKKRKNLLGAPAGKKVVVFVDDVNMPLVEEYGAQPPIELLRQFCDFKGFYDRDKLFWKDIQDMLMFVGAAPPGGGRAEVTPRFVRHFNVLNVPPANTAAMTSIFTSILSGFLAKKFDSSVQKLASPVVEATIELYQRISAELLPTPSKFHYTFNLRDISKVFQGMLMITAKRCPDAETFARLWVHECSRVFYDRLTNVQDQQWFSGSAVELLGRVVGVSMDAEEVFGEKPIVFCDFMKPDPDSRVYEEARDPNKLAKLMEDYLDNYNMEFPTQMNLVFFLDAIVHSARISRILRQPRGNAMLVGVGGSGKQSLTRIASYVAGFPCMSIEINRGYGLTEFREDIKTFMVRAGVNGESIVFLFTDSQIVEESFLEDINNVLNSGEIPNLFPQDELDKIMADMIPVVKQMGLPETRDNCFTQFVLRVRDLMHIVLCMSPVGDALRVRCRQFPSLINCTTIDWYHGWPESALISVANRFLSNLELPSDEVRDSLVKMCGFVHTSINSTAERFFLELRRRVYTTPKSYLDLINLYMGMLHVLQGKIEVQADRMEVGVTKLEETNEMVNGLQEELTKLEPVLKQKAEETERLLEQVATDQAAADVVRDRVAQEEAIVGRQATEVRAVQTDAQRDLDRALPALEKAEKALNSLTKSDITEVKSFAKPPAAVQIVLEAICVMLGEKPDWDTAKKVLSRIDFLDTLRAFDKDNIPEARLKKLRSKYLSLDEMNPEIVAKVSKAATGLCLWCNAMDVYADVAKEVGPKKARLAEMNAQLAEANATLGEKQAELKAVMDRVAELQRLCDETVAEKEKLAADCETTAARLKRAEQLTSGLSTEGVRWKQTLEILSQDKINCIGNSFLACACISYYGAFTGTYRDSLVRKWLKRARELDIPCSGNFSLPQTLGDPVQIREWQTQGLPTDTVSTANALLVTKARRWPLMIDPQGQANRWIRRMEGANLEMTTMTNVNLLRSLENCIRVGRSLMIEDLGEQLEPALEPVLQRATFKSGARLLIRLGDNDVDYDENFKLFMTTKLPNPHYLPEVCIKVTVINFTVTLEGLEEQLLGDVVKKERPEIEEEKVKLLLQMAADNRQLAELEARILQLLSESKGNILDDEVLINTLDDSQKTAGAIKERVRLSEETEAKINEMRNKYTPVATRGSLIYFVIADLAQIDPMYQYSLAYYQSLFNRCIDQSPQSDDLETRIANILAYATEVGYENICRGLFEKDKLLYSALICFAVFRHNKQIHGVEWDLFIRGPGVLDRSRIPPNPLPDKISQASWDILFAAQDRMQYTAPRVDESGDGEGKGGEESVSVAGEPGGDDDNHDDGDEDGETKDALGGAAMAHGYSSPAPFDGILESIGKGWDGEWADWLRNPDCMSTELPAPFQDTINSFQRLILIKALREDRLLSSVATFVGKKLGASFATSPAATMEDVYQDLRKTTPCIFVLSTGADPTGMLLRFARDKGYGDRMHLVSLGQGQGPVATKLVKRGRETGDWVLLQNCMLAKSWMPSMEQLVFEIQENADEVHDDFRLYLTSMPADYFPVSVLQGGVKMTTEPPMGIRANVLRSYANLVKEEDYESSPKSHELKKLLCAMAFFHANIQERRKFGPLGWNIQYAYDESDLETSIAVLRRFLEEQDEIPWDALRFVTGHINYGGRVTDDWDRRCLMSILGAFITPQVLEEGYKFSPSGVYYAPPSGTLAEALEYMRSLPMKDAPDIFGMHENANVTFNTNESLYTMTTMLSLQPRVSGGGSGKTSDEIVIELATEIESKVPDLLDEEDAGETTFVIQENGLLTSLAIVLQQEMIKFNRLLKRMTTSLRDIKRAIGGLVVMSSDLDKMYTSFMTNAVPEIWSKVSFASLKTLGSWVKDLLGRVAFKRQWLTNGLPTAFPFPVFFFPQGFMTGTLQTFARKHMEAVDTLSFKFNILDGEAEDVTEHPEDGVIVYGIFLEGARYDRETKLLAESRPKEMYTLLPPIHFEPRVNYKKPDNCYACPVYKTAVRQGTLSTTGLSTNFVLAVNLEMPTEPNPAQGEEDFWVRAGSAGLLALSD